MNICNMYCSGKLFQPDITVMVDWALKINYIYIYIYLSCMDGPLTAESSDFLGMKEHETKQKTSGT